LLDKFNPKVSAIEELNDLKTLSIDELLGTLTAYEMIDPLLEKHLLKQKRILIHI
jgi:hypothetical protein